MKTCRIAVALVLLCAVCLSLCACGISKKNAIGTWQSSYVYEGNTFNVTFVLDDDGDYNKVVVKNGAISKVESGTYEIKGGKVVLHADGDDNVATKYTYKNGKLVNNNHEYVKVK